MTITNNYFLSSYQQSLFCIIKYIRGLFLLIRVCIYILQQRAASFNFNSGDECLQQTFIKPPHLSWQWIAMDVSLILLIWIIVAIRYAKTLFYDWWNNQCTHCVNKFISQRSSFLILSLFILLHFFQNLIYIMPMALVLINFWRSFQTLNTKLR